MTTNTLGFSTPQLAAIAFGTLAMGYAGQALFAPISFADAFGFPHNPDLGRNPFVTATGGRTAALAIAIIAFAVQDNVKASGTVLSCCALSGFSDVINCYAAGNVGSAMFHFTGTGVLGLLSWYLVNT